MRLRKTSQGSGCALISKTMFWKLGFRGAHDNRHDAEPHALSWQLGRHDCFCGILMSIVYSQLVENYARASFHSSFQSSFPALDDTPLGCLSLVVRNLW